jgi:NitT/TauT family transport system ATP-binding protein
MTEGSGRVGVKDEEDSPFLRVDGVRKVFTSAGESGAELLVLDDVSWSARRGEFTTLIGPSGCGKSTLLNCIAGLASYDTGSISLAGEPIAGPGPDRAMVFQHASLLPWRTIARNVSYGLELRREHGAAEIAERTQAAIDLVGLSGFESRYPHQLSGGMQQRANLARALAVDPDLILMDEPFASLDALTKETLQDELSSLIGKIDRTTVFVTHDIVEAVFLADTVLVMSSRPGRIEMAIPVSFPRPRARSITESAEFDAIVRKLRELLRGETHAE